MQFRNTFHTLLLFVLTSCLAACGISGGNESGSTVSNSATNSVNLTSEQSMMRERVKELTKANATKVSFNSPGVLIANEALTDIVNTIGIAKISMYQHSYLYGGDGAKSAIQFISQFSENLLFPTYPSKGEVSKLRDSLSKKLGRNPSADIALKQIIDCQSLFLSPDGDKEAANCKREIATKYAASIVILLASQGTSVSNIPGESSDLVSKQRKFPPAAIDKYARGVLNSTAFANMVLTDAGTALTALSIHDYDAAKEVMAKLIWEMPRSYFEEVDQKVSRNPELPLNTKVLPGEVGANLTFVDDRDTVEMTPHGPQVYRSGSLWWGDSTVSGIKIELALEESSGASISKKQSISGSQSNGIGKESKSGVTVQ